MLEGNKNPSIKLCLVLNDFQKKKTQSRDDLSNKKPHFEFTNRRMFKYFFMCMGH